MLKQEKTKPCASAKIAARLEQREMELRKLALPIVEHCLRSVKLNRQEVSHA